jgi:transposase
MVKLQMKIGGCWRSVRTAARYCLIHSYLGTARNHGIHPLDAQGEPGRLDMIRRGVVG